MKSSAGRALEAVREMELLLLFIAGIMSLYVSLAIARPGQLNTRMPMDVSNEANEIQKEVERTLLPLTVDWRAFTLLGST